MTKCSRCNLWTLLTEKHTCFPHRLDPELHSKSNLVIPLDPLDVLHFAVQSNWLLWGSCA